MRGIRVRCGCGLMLGALAVSGVDAGQAAAACAPLFHPARGSARPLTDPVSLAPGDFTGDGRVDLAFSREVSFVEAGSTGIGVLPAQTPGVFGPPVGGLTTVSGFEPIVSGELTGDKHLDLATAADGSGLVVLAGNGSGSFTPRTGPALGAGTRVRAVADVSGDGHADVIAAEPLGPAGTALRVLLGDGGGGFMAKPPIRAASDAATVTAADINGDGAADLVVGSFVSNFPGVKVLLGNGRGEFTAVPRPVTWRGERRSGDVLQLAVADFSADGHPDIAVRRANAPHFILALGDGRGRFRQHGNGWSAPQNSYADSLAVGRFNGDRRPDVAIGSWTYEGPGRPTWITVLLADGRGGWREAPGSPYADAVGIGNLVAADLDGDHFDDLVGVDVPTANSGTLHVLSNAGGRMSRRDRVPIRERPPDVRERFERTDGDFLGSDVIYGERVRLAAYLTCERAALPGRSVGLYRRLAKAGGGFGRWRRIGVRVTRRRGRVAATVTPPMNAQYQWRPADRRHPTLRRGPVLQLTVAPHITVRVAKNGTVTGRADPPLLGAKIRFLASDGGGGDEEQWTLAGTATVRRSGAFRHRALAGGVEYIASLRADRRYAVGISPRFG